MKFAATLLLIAMPIFAADTRLPEAVKAGQRPAAIDMIAKKSADVNAAEADGSTALLWAANLNDVDLVSRL
jgi:ankyrin repeat protein